MTNDISIPRLYLLRALYFLLAIGLGITIWPSILNPAPERDLMHGVVACMLGALAALAVLGIRHPLRMLPLLLFELAWKTIWLVSVALPMWSAHRMDVATRETAMQCLPVVIFVVIIPWRHVFSTYVVRQGDPWGVRKASLRPI